MLLNYSSSEEIDVHELRKIITLHGFCIIRGLFSRSDIRKRLHVLTKKFNQKLDIVHNPKDLKLAEINIQKLIVGGSLTGSPRLVRKFYNKIGNADYLGMQDVFSALIRIRNKLLGSRIPALLDDNDIAWTCPMIAHYPPGGGFMATHRDIGAKNIYSKLGITNFFQLVLVISEMGQDFNSGGSYIHKENGELIQVEKHCRSGDILVYPVSTPHGVEEIDTHKLLELESSFGRYVAMVPLFLKLDTLDQLLKAYEA